MLTVAMASGAREASAQCTVTRAQVLADVEAGLTSEEIDAKYANCTAESAPDQTGTAAAGSEFWSQDSAEAAAISPIYVQTITNTGNTSYEALKSCGYHPQREELACTVEIRQRFGFGGQICQTRGSHEYVLFCVDYGDGFGLVPVHTNGFHIHDERFGQQPNWYFAAVVQSNPRLLSLPNDGRTLRARAILSWQVVPTNCNQRPYWGNQADFRIRLDP